MNLPQDHLLSIVRAAVQAPSADNDHQVRFDASSGSLRIWSTGDNLDERLPHRRVLTLISLGALVENACLHAQTFGLDGTPSWFPDPSQPRLICEIGWMSRPAGPTDPLAAGIDLRHTNRAFFGGPALDQALLDQLTAAAAVSQGARVRWLDTRVERRAALHLIRRGETERFRSEVLHAELFAAVRFETGWENSCEVGIPPGALGVEPPLRIPFAAMRHWKIMRMLNLLGAHAVLGLRAAYIPCRLSPHLAAFVSDLPLEQGAIATGKAMERFWLQAALAGISLQPLAASTVLPLQTSEDQGTTERFRAELSAGWRALTASRPFMVVRLGRAPPPTVWTSRRPAASYT